MTRLRILLMAAAAALPIAPAVADVDESQSQEVTRPAARGGYPAVFAAIHAGDWSRAAAELDATRPGPLHPAAQAELYLAKGSPTVSLDQLEALIAAAPELPQAPQLARLALTRGATEMPALPPEQKLVWQGSQPRRGRARTTATDRVATALEAKIQPLIVDDRPSEAEALAAYDAGALSPETLAEFRQRIAWSYYLVGNDRDARRLADMARGASGEWGLQAAWVSGLAAWRTGDCNAAADAFATVGGRSGDPELTAAGNYWAARADMKCKRPERVQQRLRTAARLNETFYGLLAASQLSLKTRDRGGLHDYRDAEWRKIADKPNVRAAVALAGIGENDLADTFIRHQARIGGVSDHEALLHLACDLDLASTQFYLAHNAPCGVRVNYAARYPMPKWRPSGGWRVDQSLVYAHALQESNFRTEVVSPAGAVGLMQVRPGTAGDIARDRGHPFTRDQLKSPSANMEFGQSYLEYLRGQGGTGGLLPKVIAAYNAGPVPISEWNTRGADRGDPLLYIESIPYWETRGYVPSVLRNYWVYEQQANKVASPSRKALAQGMWPRFPGMPGATAVRIEPRPTSATTAASD